MEKIKIPIEKIFKTQEAISLFPKEISVTIDLKNKKSDVDIIITSYNGYKMANATIENYLLLEKNLDFNIIVVETSGNARSFNKLIEHKKVSRVLVDYGVEEIHRKKRPLSPWGMMFGTSIGYYFTQAPYIFVSHNDMIATKENFLTFIKSKLSHNIRIASFTQSHIIPSVGCTIFDRKLLDDQNLDWGMYKINKYIGKSSYLQYISDLTENYSIQDKAANKQFKKILGRINWLDGGEDYVYSEIVNHNKLYICASVGGHDDYWKHPFDYYGIDREEAKKLIVTKDCPMIYAPLNIEKEEFESNYEFVLNASKSFFREGERTKRKYWRYCFDDEGDLIFIHHGRGTTRSAIKRWMKFVKKYNKTIK